MSFYKIIHLIFFILFLVFISLFRYSFADKNPVESRVIFFDVGQGDAALIQTPFNQDILIDSGPDRSIIEKLDREMGLADRDIELAVLSHNHSDHLNGFIEILKSSDFKIKKMLISNESCEDKGCEEFFKLAKNRGVETEQACPGMQVDLFCAENIDCYNLNILGPDEKFADDKNLNNTSIILKAHLPNGNFLFTGDAEPKVWNYIFDCRDEALPRLYNVDIIKVPHHGSKNGLTQELLKIASPKEAVISSGRDNSFGHPHAETLRLLDSFDVEIRRTDGEGDIYY